MKLTQTIESEYANVQGNYLIKYPKEKRSNTIKNILRTYKDWLFHSIKNEEIKQIESQEIFDIACYYSAQGFLLGRCKKYLQSDITEVSIAIKEYEDETDFNKSGIFLTCLINNHFQKTKTKKEYILITEHLEKRIDEIGFKNNGATIKIIGNVGDYLGEYMTDGEIILEGNSQKDTGCNMQGGVIYVRNSEETLGYLQKGGSIYVSENAGTDVGYRMKRGNIFLKQEPTSITIGTDGGKIYYNNKLIRGEKEE